MISKNSIISTVIVGIILSAGTVFAQDKMAMKPMPKDGMDMAAMHRDGHMALMMAYHHNAAAFSRVLWEMASGGKIENLEMARMALAEIKRSSAQMEAAHKLHMNSMPKMDAAMMEKMKPMMEKMEAEKAALAVHIEALDGVLQGSSPNARDVEMHAAALLMRIEKMDKGMKMKMEM